MSASGDTLCITCGKPAGDPVELHRLPSGELCPTCHARYLDAQPALLPGFGRYETEEEVVEETAEAEDEVAETPRPNLRALGNDDRAAASEG